MRGTREAASASAWALAPARGGSMTTPSKAFSSAGESGNAKRSRRSVSTRFNPFARRRAAFSASSGGWLDSTARTADPCASASVKVPMPAKRSTTRRHPARCSADQPGHDLLGFGGGLDEGARRRRDECPGNLHEQAPRMSGSARRSPRGARSLVPAPATQASGSSAEKASARRRHRRRARRVSAARSRAPAFARPRCARARRGGRPGARRAGRPAPGIARCRSPGSKAARYSRARCGRRRAAR